MDELVFRKKRYAFGPFIMDPIRREVVKDGQRVILTPTLFDALLYLVENSDRVVTKAELLKAVWRDRTVEVANVSQTIFMLRKALALDASGQSLIATAPGRGYRLTAQVTLAPHPHDSPESNTPEPVAESSDPPRGSISGAFGAGQRWVLALLAAVFVLVTGVAGFWIFRSGQLSPAPSHRSVAVLSSFQNETLDPIFDLSLDKLLEVDLAQSPFVSILPQRQVAATLAAMNRPANTAITPPLGAEICARNHADILVQGALRKSGQFYLMTLKASDCRGGAIFTNEKADVPDREAVAPTLDRLLTTMRRKVGESETSITRFNVPIMPDRTASLEALKAYAQGLFERNRGRHAEAVAFLKHAVDRDPDFAAANLSLATEYYNLDQIDAARATLKKAYASRDEMNEGLALNTSALFHTMVTGDTREVVRLTRAIVALYPENWSAWGNLANAENSLGHFREAAKAARHCVILGVDREPGYTVLARALMHDGQLAEAQKVVAEARARDLFGGQTAVVALELAIARGDETAFHEILTQSAGKEYEADLVVTAARDAYRSGEVRRGDQLYARAAQLYAQQKQTDTSAFGRANDLATLGLRARARSMLATLNVETDHSYFSMVNSFLAFAMLGDVQKAQTLMDRELAQSPSDTLLTNVFIPTGASLLAVRQNHPAEAVSVLKRAEPYEARDYTVPYQRGLAYLVQKNGAAAALEFRKILDHPGVDPSSLDRPLAQLGLARALKLQGDLARSRQAYQVFFAIWKAADADLPAAIAARQEFAHLNTEMRS